MPTPLTYINSRFVLAGLCALTACARHAAVPVGDAAVEDASVVAPDGGDASTVDASAVDASGPRARAPLGYETTYAFGASPIEREGPPLQGLVEAVASDRFLFGEALGGAGLALTLVRADDALHALDQVRLDVRVDRYAGTWDWTDRFTTFLTPAGEGRALLVASRQRLELLDLSHDRIESRARLVLSPTSDSLLAAAVHGDRVFTCAGFWVLPYRIDGDAFVADGTPFPLPGGTCRDLSFSADGETLWASTSRGLVPIDVRGTPTVGTPRHEARPFFRAREHGALLVTQELKPYGDMAGVLVYRLADVHAQTAPAPVARFDASQLAWPVGFAIVGDALVVEWTRIVGTRKSYVLARHRLLPDGVGLLVAEHVVRESDEVGLLPSALALAGGAHHVVVAPWRHVLALQGDGSVRSVSGTGHGSFERVWAEGDELDLIGPFDHHRFASTLESAARWGTDTARIRIAPTPRGMALVNVPDVFEANVRSRRDPEITCLRRGPSGELLPSGTVRIDGADLRVEVADGVITTLAPEGPGAFVIRRHDVPDACTGARLAPRTEERLQLAGDASRVGFAVDGEAWAVVAMTYLGTSTPSALRVAWKRDGRIARGAFTVGSTEVGDVALAGDALLVLHGRNLLTRMRAEADAVLIAAERDLALDALAREATHVLAFDGVEAYLALRMIPYGVLAVRAEDLRTLQRYEAPAPVRSMAWMGDRCAFGMIDALTWVSFTP